MEKYGFVYIWYDKKHKRFYIGAHWGREDDGYICSSSWMKRAYSLRPWDFKKSNGQLNRRILGKVSDRKNLHEEEYKWLKLIKKEELGKRYYNLHNTYFGHLNDKRPFYSEETKKKMSESRKKHSGPNKGKKFSEEHCKNLSIAHMNQSPSEETRRKISAFFRGRPRKPLSEEHKRNISAAKKGKPGKLHSEEVKRKISATKRANYERSKTGCLG